MASRMMYGFTAEDLVQKNRIEEQQLIELHDWLNAQDLPKFPAETLALFLIATKNNLKKAQDRITNYSKCRKYGPEIFNNRDITADEMEFTLRVLEYAIVPKRTAQNNVVIINRLHDFNPKNYNFVLAIKILFMVVDAAMHDDPPNGVIAVYDMNGTTLGHFLKTKFAAIKKFISYTQEGFPMYIQSVHILNITWFIGKIVSFISPLMKSGQSSTHYHKSNIDMEEFYMNHIPRQCLPRDYGGSQNSMEELHELTVQKLCEMQQFFIEEQQIREEYDNGIDDNDDDCDCDDDVASQIDLDDTVEDPGRQKRRSTKK